MCSWMRSAVRMTRFACSATGHEARTYLDGPARLHGLEWASWWHGRTAEVVTCSCREDDKRSGRAGKVQRSMDLQSQWVRSCDELPGGQYARQRTRG